MKMFCIFRGSNPNILIILLCLCECLCVCLHCLPFRDTFGQGVFCLKQSFSPLMQLGFRLDHRMGMCFPVQMLLREIGIVPYPILLSIGGTLWQALFILSSHVCLCMTIMKPSCKSCIRNNKFPLVELQAKKHQPVFSPKSIALLCHFSHCDSTRRASKAKCCHCVDRWDSFSLYHYILSEISCWKNFHMLRKL